MTLHQLKEWMYIASVEPLPIERTDWLFASLASHMWNIMRDPQKHPSPYPVSDFLIKFRGPVEASFGKQTWEEKSRILNIWAMAFATSVPGVDGRQRDG